MKKITLFVCAATLLLTACNNQENTPKETVATEDSASAPKEWVAVDSATEMKAWMDYATPGTPHAMLAKHDGEWTGQNKMWMKMGDTPVTTTSTMVNKMIMDGRYQQSTFKGDFMGMPMEGMAIGAYDNHLKKFISTWIDNMGTGVMKMEGTWDSTAKTISYIGSMVNPANGQECTMREIYTFVDDNTAKMEMFGPDSKTGKEYKTMEIVLTRKK
jgi:uncharacterized lipoprotein NlpE involved in copper resistance